MIAGGQGFLQGTGRFGLLGGVLAVVGVLRSVPVIIAVVGGGGATWALAAGTLGTIVAAVAVAVVAVLTDPAVGNPAVGNPAVGNPSVGHAAVPASMVLRASGVQLIIIVAVSVDLLLSRSVLSAHDAGLYALGAVATKAAFWLPQAVGVVFYPRLADPVRSTAALRSATRVLLVIGAVVTLAAAFAGPLVPLVVSADYRPVAGLLWLFAYTGSALAVLQLLLLAVIARDRMRGGLPVAAVLVVEVVLIATVARSVTGLAVLAAVCATASVLSLQLVLRQGDDASTTHR